MSSRKTKVLIADYSAVICAGLREVLQASAQFEVVGQTDDLQQADILSSMRHPDLVLVNPQMLDSRKRSFVDRIVSDTGCSAVAAIVYQFVDPDVLKSFHAVVNITDSEEQIVRKLQQRMQQSSPDHADGNELTVREKDILVSIARGMTNKEIADTHSISVHTVISHRKNIVRKTGIRSVSGLTIYAVLNNLIDMKEID